LKLRIKAEKNVSRLVRLIYVDAEKKKAHESERLNRRII
jgi:hypothetical protein